MIGFSPGAHANQSESQDRGLTFLANVPNG
jgi:hypothetical protein